MERRIILVRHAKSSWKSEAATDHARPLSKRGRKDAPRIGARLRELGWVPQLVLSSDSQRTRETWSLMAEGFSEPVDAAFTRRLYLAGVGEARSELVTVPSDVRLLMLLGHNNGWEEVLAYLTGEEHRMPTGAAALLEASGATWAEAWNSAPHWKLRELLTPKGLKE
jgi:phosphohistidine phosphatase